MSNVLEHDVVLEKTKELCGVIAAQPGFQSLKLSVDAFIADEAAQSQYQNVVSKGDALNHKQQMGSPMDHTEIAAFEQERDALLANPIARDFIEAQQEMHRLQQSVTEYVAKTFQLGRVPTAEDFENGSCGSGCGCSH